MTFRIQNAMLALCLAAWIQLGHTPLLIIQQVAAQETLATAEALGLAGLCVVILSGLFLPALL